MARYFSPKQMAKMHRATALSSVRRYVKDVYSPVLLPLHQRDMGF